jgi:hypothetical protein
MNILGKLFGGSKPRRESPDDDPDAKRLRIAQQKKDWKTVQEFFSRLTDLDDREFYVNQLTEWPRRPDFFDVWVDASPKCADAWLLRGTHGIKWAWEARSGAKAEQVADEAWPIFFERLKQSWMDLDRVSELNPADATPFGQKIPCAMGLQLDKKVVFDCLSNTLARSQHSWQAHSAVLFYICKKWYGSHEEMFEFARSVSNAMPEGSGMHALIPIAHHERWIYAVAFEQDMDLAEKYFDQPEIRDEILSAYNRSLGSPAHRPNKSTRNQSSFFALGLVRTQSFDQALFELNRLDDRVPEFPWVQLGDPVERYSKAKEIASANAQIHKR